MDDAFGRRAHDLRLRRTQRDAAASLSPEAIASSTFLK